MKIKITILLIVSILTSCSRSATQKPEEEPPLQELQADSLDSYEYAPFSIPDTNYVEEKDVVQRNDLFATILQRRGVDYSVVHALVQASEGVFDMKKLRGGNTYTLLFLPDSTQPSYLIYDEDPRTQICFSLQDSLWVKRHQRTITETLKCVEVTIEQSLWQDLEDAGANPLVANSLSEVYAWTIDFFGLQKGDAVKAYYLSRTLGDREFEPGPIMAAAFTHSGKTYKAFRYQQDSSYGYWDDLGENLQKAFLKAPLKYSRISSGFSYARRHPITRVVRPHTGVDYAAPKGTPVMSIGEGTVIERRYSGGGGNTVRIKHNSVYTTAYLHLSGYAKGLAVGSRVSQGQVIGYVGSTGSSTGPHLDFRVWQNGKPINPLTMESPPADPISEANKENFAKEIAYYNRVLTPNFYQNMIKELVELAGGTWDVTGPSPIVVPD